MVHPQCKPGTESFDVFISHLAEDNRIAIDLASTLKVLSRSCLQVHYYEDMPGDEKWHEWMEEKISQSDILILLYTSKQAKLFSEQNPRSRAYVSFMDIRTDCKLTEEYCQDNIEEAGIVYVRGRVSKVWQEGDRVQVKLIDIDPKTGKLKLSRKVLLPRPPRNENRDENRGNWEHGRDRGRDHHRGDRNDRNPNRDERPE